jgi:hypothetical protein
MLKDWDLRQGRRANRRRQNDEFRKFLDYCAFWDVPMPATGEQAAAYLIEMFADGATLETIRRAAAAICKEYEKHKTFLARKPIFAAIKLCAEQLSPHRTLN